MTRTERDGLLLVMVAGMLTLLGLTAAAFLHTVHLTGLSARAAAATAEVRLAAESGLVYAAGRLWESTDRFPGAPRLGEPGFDVNASRRPAVVNRGDDWHYRAYDRDDGAWMADSDGPVPVDWLDPPPTQTLHPSYAHGEPWEDLDGNALHDSGEPWNDADGNGRRDVHSVRLRGASPGGMRVRLRVEAGADAKIPINVSPDVDSPHLAPVRAWVNRLGAVLGISRVDVECENGVVLAWSDVGDRLFAAFPAGGWTRVEDLKTIFSEDEYRAIRRFVTTASPLMPALHLTLQTDKPGDGSGDPVGTSSAIGVLNLNVAPLRLLEAALRYRRTSALDRVAHGLVDAAETIDPHTELPYTAYPSVVILHPPEALRAAAGLAARARATGGFRSRLELFRFIDWQKETWFPNDIVHAIDPSYAYPSEGYQNVKVDATFASFFDQRPREVPAGLATYDVDRFVRTAPGHYPGSGRQRELAPLVSEPPLLTKPTTPYTGDQPWNGGGSTVSDDVNWTLAPPLSFDILSLSSAGEGTPEARAEGSCQVGQTVFLFTQEDFQNLAGYPPPWGNPNVLPGSRLTTRGLRVQGAPTYTTSGTPTTLDVVTFPLYPRETFDPGSFMESVGPGGVALAHAPQDYLSPTDGLFQARFAYLAGETSFPDDSDIEKQQAWSGTGFNLFPVFRDTSIEKYRSENIAGMISVFTTSTPFGTTLLNPNRYSFYQSDVSNPNGLPELPAGRVPVPAAFMGKSGYDPTPVGDGDFQALTNLVFHFTYTGPLSPTYGTPDNVFSTFVFALETANSTASIVNLGGSSRMSLWKRADGGWSLEFRNGSIYTIKPDEPEVRYLWHVNSWGAWIQDPNMSPDNKIKEGHTQRFVGFHKPPPAPGQPPDVTSPRDPSWEDAPAVHRITVYYFAEDADAGAPQYPPTRVRCGVFVDGQHVVDHTWTRVLSAPCLPFDHAQYDPRAAPYPSAELFYRIGPAGPIGPSGLGLDLTGDGRRILDVTFSRATDVVFATAPGDRDNPKADEAVASAQTAHDAYRAAPRDFFQRKGAFSSARYVLPSPMTLSEANWGGILPQVLWEGLSSPESALLLTLYGHDAEDALVGTIPLTLRKMPTEAAGAEAFFLPMGSPRAPLGRDRIAAFSFDASFDVSGWSAAGEPLTETPALDELWIAFKTPIRWRDAGGRPAASDVDNNSEK